MIFIGLVLLLLNVPIYSIEISLEENRAESGTIGYVDIKKIFDKFSFQTKSKLNQEIKKRQDDIDLKKKELFNIRAKREKLMWEYEIAKMYEEFISKVSLKKDISSSTISVDTASVQTSTEAIIVKSTDITSSESISTLSVNTIDLQSEEDTEPYIAMPGVGKVPVSMFKFSLSSSTLVIDFEIKRLEKEASEIEKAIFDLKEKYDRELSSQVEKENIEVFKKIYQAIEEVAKREGISVVVDKRNILFGMKSIDLTDKVIEKIEKEYQ